MTDEENHSGNGQEDEIDIDEFLERVRQPAGRSRESFLSQYPKRVSFLPSLVFALIVTVASIASWNSPNLFESWIGIPEKIFVEDERWRLLTSILIHADIKHLLSNLLFLIPFAGLLTNYFSWRVFPFLSLLLGLVTQWISLKTYGADARLLGASGLLYVLFGLWLSLYFLAETHLKWTNKLLRIFGFGLIMFLPQEFQPRVSYRTHFIGLMLGLAAGWVYGKFFVKQKTGRMPPPHLKIVPGPNDTIH